MLRSGVTKLARQGRAVLRPKTNRTTALPRSAWNGANATSYCASARCFSIGVWDDGERNTTRGLHQDGAAKPWQAAGALDIQRVTQQAMVHELVQQQTDTIQKVVPWFLQNMPTSYFNQVPEKFRVDHIKAIAAIQGKHSGRIISWNKGNFVIVCYHCNF